MAENGDSIWYKVIYFWMEQMPKDWSLLIIAKNGNACTQNGHTNELKSEVNGINWQQQKQ